MDALYDRIFRPWQFRSKEYVFIWNSLVALYSYKRMNFYVANPPPGNLLPSFVFGRCWVSHQGLPETKLAVDRVHHELVANYRGWNYGLWSRYLLFRTFERLTMFPLLADRDGEPARWYQVDKPVEARTSIEQQGSLGQHHATVTSVQRDASRQYRVSLVWDTRFFDQACTLERMGRPDY